MILSEWSFKGVFAIGALHVYFGTVMCKMLSQLFDANAFLELALVQRTAIFNDGSSFTLSHDMVKVV